MKPFALKRLSKRYQTATKLSRRRALQKAEVTPLSHVFSGSRRV